MADEALDVTGTGEGEERRGRRGEEREERRGEGGEKRGRRGGRGGRERRMSIKRINLEGGQRYPS